MRRAAGEDLLKDFVTHGLLGLSFSLDTAMNSDMTELVERVAGIVGIGEDQAQTAVHVVIGFLKEKLPPPISAELDSYLGQDGSAADAATRLRSILGF